MKKIISLFFIALMSISMVVVSAETGAGLSVNPKEGESLKSPGDSIIYTITDDVGNNIKLSDFNSNFTVIKDVKPPIKSVEIVEDNGFAAMKVDLLESNDNSVLSYNGKVTFKNKSGQTLDINLTGNVQHEVVVAQSNFKILKSSGPKLYNFEGGTNYYIYLDGDAEIKLTGPETGIKSFVYNIDPVKTLVDKYSLSNSKKAAFISFLGTPKFNSVAEVKLFIPIETTTPILYKLNGTELEKVADYKVEKTNGEPVIAFKTNELAKTYVITAGDIEGTKVAKSENLLNVTPEASTPDATTTQEEPSTQDVDDANSQTGSKEPMLFMGLTIVVMILSAYISKAKADKKQRVLISKYLEDKKENDDKVQ